MALVELTYGAGLNSFVGVYANDAAATTAVQSVNLDVTGTGSSDPQPGMTYYNSSLGIFKSWNVAALGWVSEVSEDSHRTLRHLVHFIDDGPAGGFLSGAYKETLPTGNPFPTSYIWWVDNTKVHKIVELTVTRSGPLPVVEVWEMYDTDGVSVLETVTDTITYSGVFEIDRTRVIA